MGSHRAEGGRWVRRMGRSGRGCCDRGLLTAAHEQWYVCTQVTVVFEMEDEDREGMRAWGVGTG